MGEYLSLYFLTYEQCLAFSPPFFLKSAPMRVTPAARSGSRRSIAAPQPPKNGTCEFAHMLAQAELSPLTERGFDTASPWL